MHDSIYTTVSDLEKLELVWNKQFQELIASLPSNQWSHVQMNEGIDEGIDNDIEEIEEFDFEDAPISSINDRQRYVLDEFEYFPDYNNNDLD